VSPHPAAGAAALVPRVPTLFAHNQTVGRGGQERYVTWPVLVIHCVQKTFV
jgi:hypothetical protein